MHRKARTKTVAVSACRVGLVVGATTSALWGCADSGNGTEVAAKFQTLAAADIVLDGTPPNATPASDTAFSLMVAEGNLISRNLVPQDAPVRTEGVRFEGKAEVTAAPGPLRKLSKDLEDQIDRLGAAEGNEMQEVLVTFKQSRTIPRFRVLNPSLARDAEENIAAARENDTLVANLVESRKPDYDALGKSIAADQGAQLGETFWLINGGVVRVPANRLRSLASRADVQYVEPVQTHTPPPANDLANVRATLNTNWLYNNVGGYIGLLDTGVRSTHERLSGRLSWVRDCVNGTSNNCGTGSGLDPSDGWNHGTSTANALSGLPLSNSAHQGVTKVAVDSFKVYTLSGLNSAASVRGFQATVAGGDYVVVAEIQSTETETGAIATAADACYDAGKIVVAANGNYGPNNSTVRSPARAHKVIGVGNHDQNTGAIDGNSGRGPTADGRTKPDIMGISIYTAAANTADNAYQTFNGTSAATPTVGGAMQLWRLWSGTANPGTNYATAIALGDNFVGAAGNNDIGAGIWRSPNSFWIYGNSVGISQGSNVDINLPVVSAGDARVQAAIWWPEGTSTHNDIDVHLINPSGITVASSTTANGVFEKVSSNWPVAGTWKIRIQGYSVTGTQTVFYAALRVAN